MIDIVELFVLIIITCFSIFIMLLVLYAIIDNAGKEAELIEERIYKKRIEKYKKEIEEYIKRCEEYDFYE